MAILDSITPAYYEALSLSMERVNGDVVASYSIAIRNVNSNRMAIINQASILTAQEKAAIVALFQRDKAQFELASGLQEWVPPSEP